MQRINSVASENNEEILTGVKENRTLIACRTGEKRNWMAYVMKEKK